MSTERLFDIVGFGISHRLEIDQAWQQASRNTRLGLSEYRDPFDIIFGHYRISPQSCSMTNMAETVRKHLRLDIKTASKRIKSLIDLNLFEPVKASDDGRKTLLIPTDEACRIVREFDDATLALVERHNLAKRA